MTVHCLVIDNVESGLSAADISDFISHHASVKCSAFMVPSPSTQGYNRAALFLEGEESYKRVYRFAEDENTLIVTAASGRPLVILEHKYGTPQAIYGELGLDPKDMRNEFKSKEVPSQRAPQTIKLVHKGTQEFNNSMEQKNLFMEFHDHVKGLNHRLKQLLGECASSSKGKGRR